MAIQTQSFTTIVSNMVAAIQGAAAQLVDFTIGSILRSFVEAVAAVALWLQGLALQVAALTRLATSNGSDADSFGADYGFFRLPAQPSSGTVTFARFTATSQATIPVGTIVQTADGTEQYSVIADTTQAAFSAILNAYVIPALTVSANATIRAVTAGSASNAAVGVINTLGSAIPNVDTVTNPAAFTNGANAETDSAFRARFVLYIASLAEGTPAAVRNAVLSIQSDVSLSLTEDFSYAGVYTPGYFYAVVNDGSGAPPSSFLAACSAAIDAVRPIGSTFGVFAPVVVPANVSMTLTTAAGYTHTSVVALVVAALTTYIDSLSVGNALPYTRLAQIAYDASAGVTNVSAVTLNGGTADLSANSQQVITVGTLTVT